MFSFFTTPFLTALLYTWVHVGHAFRCNLLPCLFLGRFSCACRSTAYVRVPKVQSLARMLCTLCYFFSALNSPTYTLYFIVVIDAKRLRRPPHQPEACFLWLLFSGLHRLAPRLRKLRLLPAASSPLLHPRPPPLKFP